MDDQFVSYDIAIRLRNLGFTDFCFGYYENKEFPVKIDCLWNSEYLTKSNNILCAAPLWQQVITYLRERYFIDISINNNYRKGGLEYYEYTVYRCNDILIQQVFKEYYNAQEAAILKTLDIIEDLNKLNVK